MVGIYKLTNRITGKSYVGQSTNIHKRYIAHKARSKSENTFLYDAIRQYGFENFDFSVIEECEPDELNKKEQFYIFQLNTVHPNGYNVSVGGDAPFPVKLSYEEVETIKDELKRSCLTETEIAKNHNVSISTVSLINLGKMWVDEKSDYPLRLNKGSAIYNSNRICLRCGKTRDANSISKLCITCWRETQTMFIPTKNELAEMLKTNSQEAVGEKYGVTGKAVSKWRKKYGLDINGNDV